MSALENARAAWGDELPEWVAQLASECETTSQNRVAGRLGPRTHPAAVERYAGSNSRAHAHKHASPRTHTCTCTRARAHAHACTHTHIHIDMHAHKGTHARVCTHAHPKFAPGSKRARMCARVCMHVYVSVSVSVVRVCWLTAT